VSSSSARHRKPSRFSASTPASPARARHRKQTHVSSVRGPVVIAAAAGITLVAGAGAAFAVTSLGAAPHPASGLADTLKNEAAGTPGGGHGGGQDHSGPLTDSANPNASPSTQTPTARPSAKGSAPPVKSAPPARHLKAVAAAAAPVYRNPLRDISGLIPERVDMGCDFGGSGPIYALGNAVITNATADNSGWPGGGWITYQLTSGPAAGLQVYVAEDVTPAVQVGQKVTSSTVVANMFVGSAGIETGWAMPDGLSAESQLPAAGGVSGGGPFPTEVGLNFDSLLQTLGVPAGPNYSETGYGTLPSTYPTSWASLKPKS
jgi:hypothetical protein